MEYIRRIVFAVLVTGRKKPDTAETLLYRFSKKMPGSEAATFPAELEAGGVRFEYDDRPSMNTPRQTVTYNYLPRWPVTTVKLVGRDQRVPLLRSVDREKLPQIVDALVGDKGQGYSLRITDLAGRPLT